MKINIWPAASVQVAVDTDTNQVRIVTERYQLYLVLQWEQQPTTPPEGALGQLRILGDVYPRTAVVTTVPTTALAPIHFKKLASRTWLRLGELLLDELDFGLFTQAETDSVHTNKLLRHWTSLLLLRQNWFGASVDRFLVGFWLPCEQVRVNVTLRRVDVLLPTGTIRLWSHVDVFDQLQVLCSEEPSKVVEHFGPEHQRLLPLASWRELGVQLASVVKARSEVAKASGYSLAESTEHQRRLAEWLQSEPFPAALSQGAC